MILSRYFVFVHFPKTGGTFVKDLLKQHPPGDWQIRMLEDHLSVRDIPAPYQTLPRFGFIRNPWDWYVSWYFYLRELGTNAFFNQASEHGQKDFESTMRAIFEMDFIKSSGVGGYSWYLQHTFGSDLEAVDWGRFEDLRAELLRLLQVVAAPLPESLVKAIHAHPKSNISRREHYRCYYDNSLRDYVADKDQAIIQRFGYAF